MAHANESKILFKSRLVRVEDFSLANEKDAAYYASYLLINFGYIVANPEHLNKEAFTLLCDILSLEVPSSFYDNPQDTFYFDCEELLLEQIASYWFGYGTPDKRYELFEKALPKYPLSTESHQRTYRIISKDEARVILHQYALDLCRYKRPFSCSEEDEITYLYKEGYISSEDLLENLDCKDNIFLFLEDCPNLAKKLDLKDVVKLSYSFFGEGENFMETAKQKRFEKERVLLEIAYKGAKRCPLSKKQAKWLNKISELLGEGKHYHSSSPDYYAIPKIKEGEILDAAKVYAHNGSLLLRNLKYLLSRADDVDAEAILQMIPARNPAALFQIYSTLDLDEKGRTRAFKFINNQRYKVHMETNKEAYSRRSLLSDKRKQMLSSRLKELLEEYYESLKPLGRIYLSDSFKKVALPLNTAASGDGVDVLPSGSRIPFEADYLRVFCYWHKAMDIDASLTVLRESELRLGKFVDFMEQTLSWRTYSSRPLDGLALCSGDDTSCDGAEYQDIDINGLAKKYRYAVSMVNGYGSMFDRGTIKSGVQIKENLRTKPWDPKNIAFEINIHGSCRSFTNFAVDLVKKEIIIINAKSNYNIVATPEMVLFNSAYLTERYLDFSMYDALSLRGELVETPEEADIVFDSEYQKKEDSKQEVIRPYDAPALVAFATGTR